jgi:hypothetical protein
MKRLAFGAAALAAFLGPPSPSIRLAAPLPVDLPVTGSFGEYRRGHLHAGLDFSTRGELGWPVRAAADGEVFRLKVEPRGYGRAVYVRHAGGYVTVYGHLHAFDDGPLGLERFVAERARETGARFPGDLYLDPPRPVRAGQVLGLSGERGGGLPHLHFELRLDDEPVDPIRYGGLEPRGFAAPVLEALWIVPRGATRVDGAYRPARHAFARNGDVFRLAARPRVEGPFDLEVTAHVPGSGEKGVSRLELTCGGHTLYRADLHRFSFDQYRQSGLVYDPSRTASSPPRFTHRLRAAPGMDVPGVEGTWPGQWPEGPLACTLAAEEPSGRRSAASFALEILPSPGYASTLPARVEAYEMRDGLLLLNGDLPFDPMNLPAGADRVPGMPAIVVVGRRAVSVAPLPGLSIRFPEDAAYGPAAVAIGPDPGAPRPRGGLEVAVPPVRVGPEDLFLRREAVWTARAADPERTALYGWDGARQRWEVVGKRIGDGAIEEATRHGGTYAVLRDVSPPRIESVQIRDEPRLGARRLVFPVREVGEGIDVGAFEATIGGQPADAEYDPDRGWGEVWLAPGLTGRRAVSAACRDRAGNRSERFQATVTF